MTRRGYGRLAAASLALIAGLIATLVPAAPAAAHPLGLPSFAQISAVDSTVTIQWNAAPDDVAALARSLGLTEADALTLEQDARLAAAPELRARVLSTVTATQDGRPCAGELAPVDSVVRDGLRVQLRCRQPVEQVRVRIALLHEVDSRYRTLAGYASPDGTDRVMFSAADPVHDLRLAQAAAPAVAGPASTSEVQGAFGGALPLERRFVAAIDSRPGPLGVTLALLVAFAVGALHALAPGHGKAVAAGYLIGERARVRHAIVLGGSVALMHTGSVLALGLALFSAARAPDAARLSAAIALVTGLLFTALGLWLLARRWRSRAAAHQHQDGPEQAGHPHTGAGPASLSGVVGLGAAGGLLPSPSALLVLLTALAVDRLAYGLTLIATFSLGLAATVTLVGVAVLRGRDVLHDRAGARLHRLVHAAPLAGATAVTVVGATIAARAGSRLL